MARTTGLIQPERPGFSRVAGVLLGFGCVVGLYFGVQTVLGGPGSITEPGPEDDESQTQPLGPQQDREDRTSRKPIEGGGVESAVGYSLRCLEAQTRERLEGLRAFDLETGRYLGASDYEGLLTLPGIPSQRILIYGDGFFYRMLGDRSAAVLEPGQKTRTLEVYRDHYTLSLDLRTDFPGKVSKADRIYLMVRPVRTDGAAMDGASFPTARFGQDRKLVPGLRRAWLQHRMLATMDPESVLTMKDAPAWVIGEPLRPLLLPTTGGRVRFAEVGTYQIRAWTSDGLVARQKASIQARERGQLSLQFRPGKTLRLRLDDGAGQSIPGARVYLSLDREGEDTEQRDGVTSQSKSGGELSFSGLFGDEKMSVRVEASGFKVLEQSLPWTEGVQRLTLQRLATRAWRIQVREKGSGDSIPGVHMTLHPEKGGRALTGTTDEQGALVLPLAIGETFRLELHKQGFVDYAEMIDSQSAQTAPDRFEMIPESLERQARLGLICLIEGTAPVGDKTIVSLWIKDPGFRAPGEVKLRRFLTGARTEPQTRTKLDAKGRFRLWTDEKGQATLVLLSDSGKQTKDVLLVPGKILHPKF